MASEKRTKISVLEKTISDYENKPNDMLNHNEYLVAKGELENIFEVNTRGQMLRAKCQ